MIEQERQGHTREGSYPNGLEIFICENRLEKLIKRQEWGVNIVGFLTQRSQAVRR